MVISRRGFLAALFVAPVLGKVFPQDLAGEDQEELLTLPEVTSQIAPRHFATSRTVIHGPCKIYDFLSSGAGGKFAIVRDNGAMLMHWAQHPFVTFRWVAVPGSELIVPPDSVVRLVQLTSFDKDSQCFDGELLPSSPDWMTWTLLERPDEDSYPGDVGIALRADDYIEDEYGFEECA